MNHWNVSSTEGGLCFSAVFPAAVAVPGTGRVLLTGWVGGRQGGRVKRHRLYQLSESEREVAQLCPTLCDPTDCSPPGSSVRGILQARILEWVAISFSRGSSQAREQTQVPALQADALRSEPPRKSQAL